MQILTEHESFALDRMIDRWRPSWDNEEAALLLKLRHIIETTEYLGEGYRKAKVERDKAIQERDRARKCLLKMNVDKLNMANVSWDEFLQAVEQG